MPDETRAKVDRKLADAKFSLHELGETLGQERYMNDMTLERKQFLEEMVRKQAETIMNLQTENRSLNKEKMEFGRQMLAAQVKDRDKQIEELTAEKKDWERRYTDMMSSYQHLVDEVSKQEATVRQLNSVIDAYENQAVEDGNLKDRISELEKNREELIRARAWVERENGNLMVREKTLTAEIKRLNEKVERYKNGAETNEEMARKYVNLKEQYDKELEISNTRYTRINNLVQELKEAKIRAENTQYFREQWMGEKVQKVNAERRFRELQGSYQKAADLLNRILGTLNSGYSTDSGKIEIIRWTMNSWEKRNEV